MGFPFDEGLAAIAPTVEFPPAIPLTLQDTLFAEPPVPLRIAVKTCAPPTGMFVVAGEMEMVMEEGDDG